MPRHRLDPDDAAVARRRLSRFLGDDPAQATAGVPAQAGVPAAAAASPGGARGPLVAPQMSGLAWLLVAGLGVLVFSGYLMSRHHGAVAPAAPSAAAVPAAAPTPSVAQIVVDVGGRVRHPGLVTLPLGARVADAIAAAGGALRRSDIALVDLAARVSDGQLLLIGVPGAAGGAISAGGSASAGGGATTPVDLNSATAEQLDGLPGVGPVLAQRIVDWRTEHGGFRSVDDLQQVPGIGPRKFADLKALVSA
jgi:competence protein ComEA